MKAEKNKFLTLSVYVCKVIAFLLLLASVFLVVSTVLEKLLPSSDITHYLKYFKGNIFRVLGMLFISVFLSGFGQFTKSVNEKKIVKSWILRRADILIYLYCCLIVVHSIYALSKLIAMTVASGIPSIVSLMPSLFIGTFAKVIFWLAFSVVLKRVMKLMEDSYKTESVTVE